MGGDHTKERQQIGSFLGLVGLDNFRFRVYTYHIYQSYKFIKVELARIEAFIDQLLILQVFVLVWSPLDLGKTFRKSEYSCKNGFWIIYTVQLKVLVSLCQYYIIISTEES